MTRETKQILAVLAVGFAICLAALWYTTAEAKADSWTGCYAGANVGYSMTDTDATLSSLPPIPPLALNFDGLGAQGAIGGLGVGCDVQMNRFVLGDRFVLGVWGTMAWHEDSEFNISLAGVPGIGNIANLAVEDEWAVGGRAGYLVTPDVLAYGLLGWGKMQMSDLTGLTGTPLSFSFDTPEFSGVVYGAGLEAAIGNGWFLKAEYRYFDLDSETIAVVPGLINFELDPDIQTGIVGISYKFNWIGGGSGLKP